MQDEKQGGVAIEPERSPGNQAASLSPAIRFVFAAARGDLAELQAIYSQQEIDASGSVNCAVVDAAEPSLNIAKGDCAIIAATRCNQLDAVKWLLQCPRYVCDFEQPNLLDRNWTALHYAVVNGNASIVQELLARGAHPFNTASHGHHSVAPFDLALEHGRLECVILMEAKFPELDSAFCSSPESRPVGVASKSSYDRWGGWAVAVSSCDDLAQVRREQPEIDRLLGILDQLDTCGQNVDSCLWSSGLTWEDRNRLGS